MELYILKMDKEIKKEEGQERIMVPKLHLRLSNLQMRIFLSLS